jgi:hypothetical protein
MGRGSCPIDSDRVEPSVARLWSADPTLIAETPLLPKLATRNLNQLARRHLKELTFRAHRPGSPAIGIGDLANHIRVI